MREDWERQHETLALRPDEAAALLRPLFPHARVKAVAPVAGGKANTNLKITLAASTRPLLLRLFVRDRQAGAKEAAILARLVGRVAVPEVLHFADDNPVTGHAYAILEWIDGQRMDQALAGADEEARREISGVVGESLAGVGEITFAQSGFLAPDLSVASPFGLGASDFQDFVEETLGKPRVQERIEASLSRDLLAFAKREAAILDHQPGPVRLTHGDCDPSNILLRQSVDGWHVAAVLDWEFACAATPLIDLGHLLRAPWGDDEGFVGGLAAGYRAGGGALADDWLLAAKLCDLLAWVEFLDRPGDRRRLFAEAQATIRQTLTQWPKMLARAQGRC